MIDRREFGKLAGLGLFALLLPALPAGDETMEFSRLLEKLGRGQRLSESELVELRFRAQAIDEVTTLAKAWVNQGTSVPIFQSRLDVIYSSVLAVDTASLVIPIPNRYDHLMIFGAGRTNGAGTSSDYLLVQLNSDAGNNYITQFFTAVAAVLTGTRVTAQTHGVIGLLAQGGRTAGDVGSFYTIIPHYNNSDLNKNMMSTMTLPFGSLITTASNWDSLDPITSLTLSSAADDIAAGSIISVYGIK